MHNKYRGQEIAVSAMVPLIDALLDKGVHVSKLLPLRELDSPRSRISWNHFLSIVKIAKSQFSNDELMAIGASGLASSHYRKRVRWARRLLTLEDAYRFMVYPHKMIDYGCIQAAVDAQPGHVRITSILREGYEPSDALFVMLRGAALELPKIFGAEEVRLEGEQTARYMHFDIHFSQTSPKVRRWKHWLSAQLRNTFFAWNNTNAISELIDRTFALEQALVERDAARLALEKDREQHRRRMQNVGEVVAEFDHLNQIRYLSPNCERVFGYPNSVLLSDPLKILRPQDRAQAEAAMANPTAIKSGVYPILTLHADGRLMQVEVTIAHFTDRMGRPLWLATFRDIGAIAVRQPATLPAMPAHAVNVSAEAACNESDSLEANGRPTLLFADDDQITRRIAQKILTKAGYSVRCVGAGTEVLEQLDNHEFSGVLLDINMPGMSGIEVYEALQARSAHPPVIFVSGNPDLLTSKHSKLAVVTKPFRSAQLLQAIREATAA